MDINWRPLSKQTLQMSPRGECEIQLCFSASKFQKWFPLVGSNVQSSLVNAITLAALSSLVSQRLISFRWDWSLRCYEVNLPEVEFSGSKIIRKKGCLLKIHSMKNGPTFHLLTFIWFSFYSYFDWCFHPRKDCYTYLYPITLLFYFSRGS